MTHRWPRTLETRSICVRSLVKSLEFPGARIGAGVIRNARPRRDSNSHLAVRGVDR
jgi:hypothetical protein